MDLIDLSYLVPVALAGALARSCAKGLPAAWRMRLEAEPPDLPSGRWVWLHAVSVGELILAEGLVGRLREAGHRIHLTTGTPAGLDLLARRLPAWDRGCGQVTGGAFPLDDPEGMAPFLCHPPGLFIALETELWPNLLRALEARSIPRCVVNGRLTERSLARGGPWLRRAASRLSLVAARDEGSAQAFRELGAPHLGLGGNLKTDLPPPAPLHAGWEMLRAAWAEARVLVAGNTVDGEEDLILGVWEAAKRDAPGLRLILAPRQPRRFERVADLLARRGLAFRRASSHWPEQSEAWLGTEVLLLDTLGELPAAYAEGTLALVAGGWRAEGGHNPLEPARAGLAVVVGPGFRNFEDLVPPLREAGLLWVVPEEDLLRTVRDLLASAPLRPKPDEVPLPPAFRGALNRSLGLLEPHLPLPVRYHQLRSEGP